MSENWKKAPLVPGIVVAPQGFHNLDGLVGVRAALGEWHAHGLDFGVNYANADAQGDATARKLVQGSRLFCQAHGVVIGQHQHAGAQDDAVGLGGGVGQNGHGVVVGTVAEALIHVADIEDVVAGPHRIVAQFLGAGGDVHHILHVGKALVVGKGKADVHH